MSLYPSPRVSLLLAAALAVAGCPKEQRGALLDAGVAIVGDGAAGAAHLPPGESEISKLAPDAVVLKVDGVPFTKLRLDQAVIQAGLAAGIPPAMLDAESKVAFERPAYEKLIERQLLIGEAKKRGLYPTMEEAEKATQPNRDRLLSQLPPGKTFADVLKEMGTDEAGYRSEMQNDVAISRLLEAIDKATPEPAEDVLKKFYEDNKARMEVPATASVSHILINLAEDAPEADVNAALARARLVAGQAKGKDKEGFAQLAEKLSEDPMAKKTRGDLGTFARGDLLPEIEKVAFSLKEGQVSEPVRSRAGFHVLFGQGAKDGRMRSFDEVKPLIAQRERQRALMEAMDALLESLKKSAKIERLVEPAKSPFDPGAMFGAPTPGAPPSAAPGIPSAPHP